jgi:hypothetical protein
MSKYGKSPFRITLVTWLVLSTTVWNVVRVWTSIHWRGALQTYAPTPGALYIGASGAFWAVVGATGLWGILRRRIWAIKMVLVAAWVYAAWAWADRLLLQGGGPASWQFALTATILLLAFVTAVTMGAQGNIDHSKEDYEREPENPPSA